MSVLQESRTHSLALTIASCHLLCVDAFCLLQRKLVCCFRIKTNAIPRCVDPVIPNLDLETFQRPFNRDESQSVFSPQGNQKSCSPSVTPTDSPRPSSPVAAKTETRRVSSPTANTEHLKTDDQQADSRSLASVDSGLGGNQADSPSAKEKSDPNAKVNSSNDQSNEKDASQEKSQKKRTQSGSETFGYTEEDVMRELAQFTAVPLEKLDNHTGVLHVWFLALEGLASTVSTCPKNYQPQTLERLFDLLRSAAQTPGQIFILLIYTLRYNQETDPQWPF